MLPAQVPPVTERGAVKWVRENLFSGPFNTALTLLGFAAIYYILSTSLPWWLNGVWTASSLGECRDIIAANGGTDGACWAMINARWHQFIFGFYPQDSYWRPVLAFGLLFVALAPVLYWNDRKGAIMVAIAGGLTVLAMFSLSSPLSVDLFTIVLMAALLGLAWMMPRQLIWVTLLYPLIAFFLLWGGSVWKPLATLLGFAVLVVAYRLITPRLGVVMGTALGFVAACVYWLALQGYVSGPLTALWDLGLPAVNSDQFGGFLLAFVIGVTSITFSLPIGLMLALGRQSDMFLIKTLSVGFIEFIRGVPLITLLFTASLLLQYFLPPQTNFDLILRVIILATLFSAAYIAEVVRGGLAALPRGQYEAADALGLDYWQAQRLIIMPQALKISIPGIVSTFIGLFKDTTLVSFVGLLDPLRGVTAIVRADINWKGIYWEPYIFVGAIFFLICFSMSRYSMYLENKLKTDHR
ncbi:amino acid ABC transporter permease [Tabrizicola sp.]|uniref:amino acid ABC transporter permease n=1 Tax=Tabrizicola sp. TaxID=2005166 RepID=UPI00386A7FCD